VPSVRVLFFAQYAELVGRDEAVVAVREPATVRDVIASVRQDLAGGHDLPVQPLAALNAIHARLDAPVRDGDEVALLPPLAGG
jgi:molybdopterin converting factor small subunit